MNNRQKHTPRKPYVAVIFGEGGVWLEWVNLSVRRNRALRGWRNLRQSGLGMKWVLLNPMEAANHAS